MMGTAANYGDSGESWLLHTAEEKSRGLALKSGINKG